MVVFPGAHTCHAVDTSDRHGQKNDTASLAAGDAREEAVLVVAHAAALKLNRRICANPRAAVTENQEEGKKKRRGAGSAPRV